MVKFYSERDFVLTSIEQKLKNEIKWGKKEFKKKPRVDGNCGQLHSKPCSDGSGIRLVSSPAQIERAILLKKIRTSKGQLAVDESTFKCKLISARRFVQLIAIALFCHMIFQV